MRGTLEFALAQADEMGIIPAYAGNTSSGHVLDLTYRDHPRVCGEHPSKRLKAKPAPGSSPRMRGTPVHRTCILPRHGIIPAYAGNTRCFSRTSVSAGDHPRVCGEHVVWLCFLFRSVGSSPRMRGTHSRDYREHRTRGIIPAYAGNTAVRNFFRYL